MPAGVGGIISFIVFKSFAQAGAHAGAPLHEIIKIHLFGETKWLIVETICCSVGATLSVRPNNPEKWLFELENKNPGITVDYYAMMPNHIFLLFCSAHAGAHAAAPLPEIIRIHLFGEIICDSVGAHLPKIIKLFKTLTNYVA